MKYVFMVVLTTISFSNYAMASDDSWYWGFSIGTRIDGGVISDANQEIDQFHSNFGGSLVYGPISEVSLFYPFKNINALVGLSSGGLN